MDIRKYFGSGNVQKPSNTSVVPIEQKAEARYDISESLPKKKGTQNTKSSWRNKKEESKPTLLKQMSTASQHISDVEEADFPEVDQKRVKKKAPKLVEAKIKSTENKVFKDIAKTAFGIGDETSAKNNPDDKSKSTQYKTSKISKKVQGSLKRRHENDVSEDEDIQTPRKKKNVVASDLIDAFNDGISDDVMVKFCDDVALDCMRHKRSTLSDSDEDPLPATCRLKRESRSSYFNETFTRVVPKLTESSAVHVPEIEQKKKKPISSMDFFGFSPVQQKEGRHLVEKTTTNSRNFQEEIKGSLTLNKKSFGKRKREEEEENHIIDGDLKEATCKRPLKEEPLTVTSARGSNEVNMSDQSPARMIKPDVDSPARSAKKDEDRRKSYLAFVNREPPKALGSKEIPQGEENCLEGLTFVMTGVLESIERDDCKSLIERYGGKVTTSISRNTKYLIVGRDSGISKIAKANELKTKQINEDELFELLRTLPGKKSKYELKYEAEKESSKKSNKKPLLSASASSPASKLVSSEKKDKQDKSETKKATETHLSSSSEQPFAKIETSRSKGRKVEVNESSLLWVDKYKPISLKNIIGQQGDKSQAKKLYNWLQNWHKNMNKKPIYGRPSEDGCGFKAALLSGPPGIGKTTTAHLVCQEAGFSFFELNASDTRSKKSLKEFVSEALNCHSLHSFFNEAQDKKAVTLDGKKHCLVMDEVDGMAGNEDRGGVQEVIQLIKTSHVPVICMCNDRNHPKIRSLANHCFDLRFQRPRVEQIKGSMMSIAFKEGLKIPPPALNEIIIAANQDIRQVIHNLSMWSVKDKNLTFDQLKQDASRAQKDLHFSPFDVCRKVFSSGEDSRKMTLNDKSDLFFHDYNIAPLFVHENYLSVKPHNAQCDSWKHLKLLGEAANSMSMGDLVDGHVRRKQNWGLLPTQAMLASVIPGECLRGAISGMITFPSWLGKNSTTNKNNRILQELTLHTSLSASCNKQSLNLDYLPAMKHLITRPLIDGGAAGVEAVVTIMNSYNLLREDFDNVIELSSWSDSKDVMSQVDSKVKAAFTRSYNKESHMLPYSNIVIKKSRKEASAGGIEDLEDDDETLEVGEEEQEEDDVTTDAMIMAKKPSKSRSKNEKIPDKPPSKKGKQDQKKTRK